MWMSAKRWGMIMRCAFQRVRLGALLPIMAGMGLFLSAAPARAAGDLLVAPTRIVLDAGRSAELVLNNIGAEPATYRISLEIKRMKADGSLEEIASDALSVAEQAALDMISYSPKRVVLPPNQPQTIRLGLRKPEGLADGEYRVHMLFRAIPAAAPLVDPDAPPPSGVSIAITPIYGVTIPVIVRQGTLQATAALANPRIENEGGQALFKVDIARNGDRSVYGELRVSKPGAAEPLIAVRGIAVYPEISQRSLMLAIPPEAAAALKGPVVVQYIEDRDQGGAMLAEVRGVIQ